MYIYTDYFFRYIKIYSKLLVNLHSFEHIKFCLLDLQINDNLSQNINKLLESRVPERKARTCSSRSRRWSASFWPWWRWRWASRPPADTTARPSARPTVAPWTYPRRRSASLAWWCCAAPGRARPSSSPSGSARSRGRGASTRRRSRTAGPRVCARPADSWAALGTRSSRRILCMANNPGVFLVWFYIVKYKKSGKHATWRNSACYICFVYKLDWISFIKYRSKVLFLYSENSKV